MKDKVLEWLKKTGYPLELYGESILNELGFSIINSHLYIDSEKKIPRELDLLASFSKEKHDIRLSLNLLIECKKTDKALILLANSDEKKAHTSFCEYITIDNPHMRALIGNSPKIKMPGRSSYGFKVIQAFTDGDELMHKATNTLFKSLLDFNAENQEYLDAYIESNEHRLGMPILLIDAPLVELKLNQDNEMDINEIDSCILQFKNILPTFEREFFIPIIRKEYFKEFCSNFENIATIITENLVQEPLLQIKNHHITQMTFFKKE